MRDASPQIQSALEEEEADGPFVLAVQGELSV